MIFIDNGITDDCVNPDSYGMICVKCNQCGRFDKDKEDEQEERSE